MIENNIIAFPAFNAGQGSQRCMTELPISAFKLDRALVRRLLEDKTIQKVVESQLVLATNLGLDLAA